MAKGVMHFHRGEPVNGTAIGYASEVITSDGTNVQNKIDKLNLSVQELSSNKMNNLKVLSGTATTDNAGRISVNIPCEKIVSVSILSTSYFGFARYLNDSSSLIYIKNPNTLSGPSSPVSIPYKILYIE